jgi:anaerobic selenocysteine-containing dehydrogenase
VQVSTKLNRSHLVHGRAALILPCIARSERDEQLGGLQRITVEDAMSMVHLSGGIRTPLSKDLRSEPAIIAGMARATLPASAVPWEAYVDDYDRIRDTMAQVIEGLEDLNARAREPHGFRIPQPARERVFRTPSGRVELSSAALNAAPPADGRLRLATVRSHDQWNTTIYSNDDRYRGLRNLRTVVFMHRVDMCERDLEPFAFVDITSFAKDGSRRTVHGYRAVPYDIPRGNAIGYMPELNVLCAIGDFSAQSDQPLMKHLVVEVAPSLA